MSANRTTVSVRSDHIKAFAHFIELVRLGEYESATAYCHDHATDFQNLGGALDQADRQQYPGDYAPAPGPVIDPPGPLGRFDAAPSDWAAWAFITDAERTAFKARHPAQAVQIDNLVQFYAGGSAGGLFIPKRRDADGAYFFGRLDPSAPEGSVWVRDVDGAADKYVAERCKAEGIPQPGHLR